MRVSPQHRASTGERLNTAETTGRLQQALGKRRIRLTRQRRVILQVMDDAEQHLDVDQILERAQKIDSGVALVMPLQASSCERLMTLPLTSRPP